MNLDPVLLEILVCPDCRGSLTVDSDAEELVCDACGLAYPVRDDIPILLVDEARRPTPAGETAGGAGPATGADDAGVDATDSTGGPA